MPKPSPPTLSPPEGPGGCRSGGGVFIHAPVSSSGQAVPPAKSLPEVELIALCPGPPGSCMNLSYTALITACLVS